MQDGAESSQGPAAEPPPPLVLPPRRRKRSALLFSLLGFAAGAALSGWLVWRGDLDTLLPRRADTSSAPRLAGELPRQSPASAAAITAPSASGQAEAGLAGVETRLALLEERFSRIDRQATAASANASRAEALLIALAARRTLDRGEPLGYLADQLRLRFGGAQPQAVETIINTAKEPVTLHMLSSQLAALAPALTGERSDESTWTKVRRELAGLFVVRRTASARQLDRAERAQILLKAGRVDDAVAEIERLPGADTAQDWITAARRYAETQRALEIVETAALLEPRELRDGEGIAVDQPSPLTPPAEQAGSY